MEQQWRQSWILNNYSNRFPKRSSVRQLVLCLAAALFTCTKRRVFQVLWQWLHSFWPWIKSSPSSQICTALTNNTTQERGHEHCWPCLPACGHVLWKSTVPKYPFNKPISQTNWPWFSLYCCTTTVQLCQQANMFIWSVDNISVFFPCATLLSLYLTLVFFQLKTRAAQEDKPRAKERLLMPETY